MYPFSFSTRRDNFFDFGDCHIAVFVGVVAKDGMIFVGRRFRTFCSSSHRCWFDERRQR